jgi:hypothetical protein
VYTLAIIHPLGVTVRAESLGVTVRAESAALDSTDKPDVTGGDLTAPAGALLISRGLWRRPFRKPMTFLRYRGIAVRLGGWRRYCARS